MIRLPDFYRDLLGTGFSTRTANALTYGSPIETLAELKTREWGDRRTPGTLAWELSTTPNLGPKSLAEIEAFRTRGDPTAAKLQGPTHVRVPLSADQLAALDAFIAKQPKKVSRSEAIRTFVSAGLHLMGEDSGG